MKIFSTLLRVVLFIGAVLIVDSARGQNQSILPLQVSPDRGSVQVTPGSLSIHAVGLAGSKIQAPDTRPVATSKAALSAAVSAPSISVIPSPGFYPGDVTNPGDGPTIVDTEFHPIYVNRHPSHWGNVGGFLTDLGASDFIHVLDQYVGTTAINRYTLGASFSTQYPIPEDSHTLVTDDILNLVHAAAAIEGNGYGHLYHVFLPKGVDMCIPATATTPIQCYSPDVPANWYFCAFHASATFTDAVGHVVFSVEPYQDVDGCAVPPHGTANNQLIDSTDNVLGHETSEAISDPDGNAWWVQNYTVVNGNEIADLCIRFEVLASGATYWDYGNVDLNGHLYTIQPWYSNAVHGCTYTPD
jgi:hypothetical protein